MRAKIKTMDEAKKFRPYTVEFKIENENEARIFHDCIAIKIPEARGDFIQNICLRLTTCDVADFEGLI